MRSAKPSEPQSDLDLYEGSQPTKRPKHKEEINEKPLDLSKELAALKDSEANSCSQDNMFWFISLDSMLPEFENQQVIEYLCSPEARESNSLARTLIESAAEYFLSMEVANASRALLAAFALGDDTLMKFTLAL